MGEKFYKPRIMFPEGISFKNDGQMKAFFKRHTEMERIHITKQPTLQLSKEALSALANDTR